MTLVTNHVVSDTGHTADHNAMAIQVNQNTSDIVANKGLPVGATGATQPTRYIGRWAATGAPVSGTFAVGDFGFDGANAVQICTVAGTPGTWAGSAASGVTTTGATSGTVPVGTGPGTYAWQTAAVAPAVATPAPDTTGGSVGGSGLWTDGAHSHPQSLIYDGFGLDVVNVVGASGASVTLPDTTTAQVNYVTETAACTYVFPAAAPGKRFQLVRAADGTHSPTFPASVAWVAGTAPTWTTATAAMDMIDFRCIDGVNWIGKADLNFVNPPPPLAIIQQVDTGAPWGGTITFASDLTAHSAVLAVVASDSSVITTPSGGGLTWTRLDDGTIPVVNSTSQICLPQVWLGTNTAGGTGTATISFTNQVVIGSLYEISNAILDGVVTKGSGSIVDPSTVWTTPDLVAPGAGRMPWVVNAYNAGSLTATPTSPWIVDHLHDIHAGAGYPTGGPADRLTATHQPSTTVGTHYSTSWQQSFGPGGGPWAWGSLSFFLKHF